jgi:hypothetical protein
MSGVFRTFYPPPTPTPHRPPLVGRLHSLGGEGVGVNSSEDARHCPVLYICKYFVVAGVRSAAPARCGR